MEHGTERQQKVAGLIQQEAAKFFREHLPPKPLLTITRADVSKDLKQATVYFTTLPQDKQDEMQEKLEHKGRAFRTHMKSRLSTKILPYFSFEVDEGERARQRLDEISETLREE